MGLCRCSRLQLPPDHLALPHAGLPIVWCEGRSSASSQCLLSCQQLGAAVSGAADDHRGFLAQRLCGRLLCLASVARGIGRLDIGAQRRPEWLFLLPYVACIRQVCEREDRKTQSRAAATIVLYACSSLDSPAQPGPLFLDFCRLLRPGFAIQADAGYGSFHPSLAGFLAAAPA